MTYEFPPALRLLKPGDFRFVFEKAAFKSGHAGFLVLARPHDEDQPRLGLVIAKKHVKLATNRNRVRRQFRETFRLQQNVIAPVDYVVIARRPLADTTNADLASAFRQALLKVKRQYDRQHAHQKMS